MTDTTSRWSAGSILFLASWAGLMGPYQYAVHLTSGPRLPFTAVYFGSIIMTVYFAAGVSAPPCPSSLLLILAASFDRTDSACINLATVRSDMVSGQLLPHGKYWTSVRCQSGWRKSCRLDERLSSSIDVEYCLIDHRACCTTSLAHS
jgi:hypothetical protein